MGTWKRLIRATPTLRTRFEMDARRNHKLHQPRHHHYAAGNDELNGLRGEGYRKMFSASPGGRAGTPDEVGELAEFLMSKRGRFISGADYFMDGGTKTS